MSGSNRNAPCPCGSGRKYKVCCLRRDEAEETERGARHGGVGVAIAWLDERCPGAADEVIETGFYSIVDDDGFDRLAELPAHVQDLAELNAFDWLLADGEMALDDEGPMVPVADMVLGDGGPALFEAQRQHLEALRASPLRLYRVEQVAGAHRMIVRDALDPTTPLEVKQGAWAGEFWAGNLRGMRLLPGVPPEPSGALFPYPDALADEVVGSIREAVAALRGVPSIHAPGYDERKFVAKTIISTWLMFLVGPLPEARARSTERKHTDRKGRRLRAARDPFIVDGGSGDPRSPRDRSLRGARLGPTGRGSCGAAGGRREPAARLGQARAGRLPPTPGDQPGRGEGSTRTLRADPTFGRRGTRVARANCRRRAALPIARGGGPQRPGDLEIARLSQVAPRPTSRRTWSSRVRSSSRLARPPCRRCRSRP